ncbi:L-Ala-D/L-amino acid epimerase isoform X3 [Arachis hypogaea]|uniref:L-Ala-D/L-amino acid epimerase isoform X3 n=1 Tax=Arachis hypogaea TaxID=3818 RepID=UPI003B21CBA5
METFTVDVYRAENRPLNVPLIAPFTIASSRLEMVENVAVRIELSNGSVGWGEAPILPFVTAEDQKTAMAKASEACAFLRRCPSLTLGSMLEDIGNSDEFFKVAAPLETLGRAAAELRIMKRTRIGMDLQFDMVEVDAFVKQPDGLLFSWSENLVVLPAFFIAVILWAIMFSQFWKRKNASLLARWPITYGNAVDEEYKVVGMKGNAQPG